MLRRVFSTQRRLAIASSILAVILPVHAVPSAHLIPGDFVRLTRGETLIFMGKNFLAASKGQEFPLLQHDIAKGQVHVGFVKEDGTVIAVTLPADAVEPSPPDGWSDLVRGVEAFRDQRLDETRRLLTRAAQDPQQKALAIAISARVNAALAGSGAARSVGGRTTFIAALQSLRDTAPGLVKLGHLCLALPLDEGADKLASNAGGDGLPPSKIDRNDLSKRAIISNRAVARARQALAIHRIVEAAKVIDEGLSAEPMRPELKAWQTRVRKDIAEADEHYQQAEKMRHFVKGEVHALTAIERGLKDCADHPQLLALKKEMIGAFEERTSPPVTPEFLAAAKAGASKQALEEGHKLYTTRCTECHDLELLDSRGMSGWQKAVAAMSRRASLTDQEQSRILEYIGAAQNAVELLNAK